MPNTGILRSAFSRYSGQSAIVRYTMVYIVLSCIWIGFSDRVLYWTVTDPALLPTFATIKGWLFVAVTALLWYGLMTRNASKISSSQSAYRTLIHASPIPIAVMRIADGTYLEVNDSFVKLSGFNKNEIVGHSIIELGFYPDASTRADILQVLKRDGRLQASDRRFRTRSGELIDTLLWVEPISLDDEPLVLALALDLTDRKRAEERLKKSEQRFATVFSASPICTSLTRLDDGRFLDANQAFLSLLEYQREGVIGSDPISLNMWVYPDDRIKMVGMLREKGRSDEIETQFRSKSGKVKDVKIIAELIEIAGQRYILGLFEDISARKQAQAELDRENHRNKMLLRIASDGIHVLDLDGNVLDASDSFCKMLGYTRDELLSMNVRDWDVATKDDELTANFRPFDNFKDSIRIIERRHRRKDGSILDVEISSTAAVFEGKRIVYASARDISERKLAEEKLIKSEGELIRAQEVAHVGSWVWNVKSESILWSSEMYRIFGIDKKIFTGSLQDILASAVYPDQANKPEKVNWSDLREDRNGPLELRIEWPDKTIHYIWAETGDFQLDEQGNPALLSGIVQDITDRKAAEAELNRLRKAVETSQEIVFLTDKEGVFTYVNPEFTRVYGYKAAEIVGSSTPRILKSGTLRDEDYSLFWRTLAEGKMVRSEIVNKAKDGRLIPAEVSVSPVFNETGTIDGYLAIQRDISERKRTEESLRRSETSLAEAQRIARIGSWEWDSLTGAVVWSKELSNMLGREASAGSAGVLILSQSSPSDIERERRAIENTLNTGVRYELEFEIVKENNAKIWISARGEIKSDAIGHVIGMRGTVLDITDRKFLELQLLKAQRMETVGTLSAGVAHDFNNILNIIGGNLRLISEAPDDVRKNQGRFAAIAGVTERGAELVRQLQFFSGRADLSRRGVEVNKIIKENAAILNETFPKTIAVRLSLAEGLPPVLADPNQLHQVLLNLSVNARDAMRAGGTITFSTELAETRLFRNRFPRAQTSPYVKISVRDTGDGMDSETQRRIFDPFFTTKEVGKGTGLGLSVVLGIIESHNGFVEVESEPGKGSEFRMFIPAAEGIIVRKDAEVKNLKVPIRGTETILFVDDEELARELAVDQLTELGYTVVTASDGESAVTTYRDQRDRIAIVLSDFGLPNFDGEEVFRRLKEINPEVQFVLLTGMIEQEKIGQLLHGGIKDIVLKPYKFSEVIAKMRKLLDEKNRPRE